MGNPKFSLEDCVIEMRSEKIARFYYDVDKDEMRPALTVDQAYRIAQAMVQQETVGHPAGHRVNNRNELVPITAPGPRRPGKIKPIDIDALCAADGRISDAETHDEPEPEIEEIEEVEAVDEPVEPETTPELSVTGWKASGAGTEDDSNE